MKTNDHPRSNSSWERPKVQRTNSKHQMQHPPRNSYIRATSIDKSRCCTQRNVSTNKVNPGVRVWRCIILRFYVEQLVRYFACIGVGIISVVGSGIPCYVLCVEIPCWSVEPTSIKIRRSNTVLNRCRI